MNANADIQLAQTLEHVGLTPDQAKVTVLGSSAAAPKENSRIHRQTNDLILELLQRGTIGRCIHVTGDASALADPFHRELCSLMRRRGDDLFDVIYRLPPDRDVDPIAAVEWNLERWSAKGQNTWREKFLSLNTISSRAVDLMALDHNDEIQFSVFGGKYVQLQAKHKAEAKSKPVWLLESSRLNERLTERAETLVGKARNVDESWFTSFVLHLNCVLASYILKRVLRQAGIDRNGLLGDPNLDVAPESPTEVMRVLKAMGLMTERPDGVLDVTSPGRDFLAAS